MYLDVQSLPEFVPMPTSSEPLNISAFLGEDITFVIKAVQRNRNQKVEVVISEDPGMPNSALLTDAVQTPATSVTPHSVTRNFFWTPVFAGRSSADNL